MSEQGLVWVDGDACPVKEEVIEVCRRFGVKCQFVSHQKVKSLEGRADVFFEICDQGPDTADDHIVAGVQRGHLVVTSDLLLSRRCLKKGALVINFQGSRVGLNEVADGLERKSITLLSHKILGEKKKGNKKKRSPFKGLFHNLCAKRFEAL